MTAPPRTLQEARDAAVDELMRRDYARALVAMTPVMRDRFARALEADERRAAFHVVRA